MPLTDPKVRAAKAADRPYKMSDERGMYLVVQPHGSKLWRYDFRFDGKRKTLAIGSYPDVGVAGARKMLDAARALLAEGTDPTAARREQKQSARASAENTFEAVAREWFEQRSPNWAKSHGDRVIRRLERDVFPWLGSRPVAEIQPMELLTAMRRIEARGRLETAHRALGNCGQVLRYAVATGKAPRDPSGDLRGALAPWKPRHHPSITEPNAVGGLLRALDEFRGTFPTACALKLAPLVFVRPGELRSAEWAEFDLEAAEWRIPAHKMKARAMHIVPLCVQAVAILRELKPLTGSGRYLFPSARTAKKPMSENTINAALRRLGYAKDQMTGHGFRSMASTLLNEQGWNRDAIERQLAHGERDPVRAAYNYADLLPERRKMMQRWADYLDGLKQRKVCKRRSSRDT